ncbi:MAG: hypothetical protein CM1200mP6_10930 [Anaerolineaceae bacterium]|nr:MAG: hypothetical protein CM1200mP6_10930 [Anaerolineaceae bacterium]
MALFLLNERGDDRAALRTALKVLQNDLPLLIAPEGTRHPEGLRDPQHGASFLAMKTGVPLVPVAISGTADIFRTLRKGRKQKVGMVIGQPYHLPNLQDTTRRDALRIHTDYIMQRIAEFLNQTVIAAYINSNRTTYHIGSLFLVLRPCRFYFR